MSSPAASLARRNARFLLALAPGAVLLVLAQPALAWRVALALVAALALDAAGLALRKLPVRAHLAEGSALRAALLLALWFPTIPWPALLAAIVVALLLARHALGGLGNNPFNPAMAGAACAQLFFGASPPFLDYGGPWAGLAWLAGGLVLVALGQLRWQAPLALLAAASLAALPFERSLVLLTSGPWLLLAFFAWPEPGTHGESAGARAVAAAFAGALAVLAAGGASPRLLPFAVLAANAALPALEAWFAPRRTQRA